MTMGVWLLFIVAIFILLLYLRTRANLPHPTSTEQWVIEAFRKKRRQQWFMGVPVAFLIIFLRWGPIHPLLGAGMENVLLLILAALAGIFTYRNWRCPKCGAYLGKYPMYSGVCPKCGTALREPTR